MRTLTVLTVLIFSAAALGQDSHSTDVHCTTFKYLDETACTFGDGSGEIITSSSDDHFTAEGWGRMFPALVKADADAETERLRANKQSEAQLTAEHEKEIAAIKAQGERERMANEFTWSHDKKKCTAAGLEWQGKRSTGVCRVPEVK